MSDAANEGPLLFPPGHFYSPVPSLEDIERTLESWHLPDKMLGIDLREQEQLKLLEQFSAIYPEVPFPAEKGDRYRFAFNNPLYSWGDAITLFCMIREIRPQRIIEVGSGHSSALMLDVNEFYFDWKIQCTFVEPYPDVLLSLLRPDDKDRVTVIRRKLQDVPVHFFRSLERGDILFVDSSHVMKAGSDVRTLFFDILPTLKPGVLVHFHDIFDRFEYPGEWLREGRGWNEQYVLRSFLQFNSAFRIKLYTSFMVLRHTGWYQQHMPNCLNNPGGQIWLERVA